MRSLKIIIFIFIGFIVLFGIILAVFLATFDISHYKPQITQELSSQLSREVKIEQLRLDFKIDKGLTIVVKGFSIADDPAFSRDKILTVDLIDLNTNIFALIFHRQIVISKIEISNPRVHLVRNKDGLLNVEALSEKKAYNSSSRIQQNTTAGSLPISGSAARRAKKDEVVIPSMLIDAIRIENGALTFLDESLEPSLIIPLQQIDFQASRLSFEKPFPFQAAASLWADQQNIAVSGEIMLDLKNGRVNVQRTKLATDLSQLRSRLLPFYGVMREDLLLDEGLEGKVSFEDAAMQITQEGLGAFSANGVLTGGRLRSGLLNQPLEDIHARLHIDESNIAVTELTVSCASGTFTAQGRWSDYGRSNMFMFDLKMDGMQLAELIPHGNMPVLSKSGDPVKLEGGIYAVLDAEGYGTQAQELYETLKGDGSAEIRGGKLSNINLLRFVLDKLLFIPDLVQRIEGNLPQRYKDELESKETIVERATSTIKLKDQSLDFSADLQAEGFALTANGSLGFDQNLVLTADFFISEDLANSMSGSVPELSYLLDAKGRIHVPFKSYQGKLQDIRIYPDVEELAKKVIQNRGQDELKKAIFRALDIEENPAPAQQTQEQLPSPGEATPPSESRPEKVFIDGIFDAIFKGKESP